MRQLTDKKKYTLLRHSTLKSVSRFFLIVYIFESAMDESLAGITVSKKVGNAVTRNKIKRRIKAILRQFQHEVDTPLYICNIIALRSAVGAEWGVFKNDLENCLRTITTKDPN